MTDDHHERSLRDALGAIADAPGEPDEGAAWRRISAGAAAADGRARRNRALLGLSGIAVAGAAAALIVVLVDDDDRESVEVIPAETTTTGVSPTVTTEPTTTTASESVGGEMSERPLVVSAADGHGILLVDGDTGDVVRELARLTDEQFVTDLELAPDGTVYFAQNPPDSPPEGTFDTVLRAVTPTGEVVDVSVDRESLSPAVSNDGRLLAYAARDLDIDGVSYSSGHTLVLVDRATGETLHRYYWNEYDPDFFHTGGRITSIDFAPDNESLLLTVAYEGSELLRLDLDADDLTDGVTPIANVDAPFATWAPDGRVLAWNECCYPDHDRDREVVAIDPAGTVTTVDRSGAVVGLSAESSGDWVQYADGTIRRLGTDLELRPDIGDPGVFGPWHFFDAG